MRRAAWMVIAAVGLSACTAASKTSTSTQTTTPSAVATSPTDFAASTPTGSGSASITASPTGGGTAAAGTRADYLSKAKPTCESVTKVIDALPEPGNNEAEKLKILDQRGAALTEALNKLQALTPPAKDAASVRFVVDHLTAVRDDTVGQAAALRAGDTVKAGQLEARFDSDENIAKNAANDFGLGDCGA